MKDIYLIFLILLTISCGQTNNDIGEVNQSGTYDFNSFDETNHLRPVFEKNIFDTLHGMDLGWALLEPINIAKSDEDEQQLLRRFSPGQKALYFIWHLDAEVTNGGFIQFYWNEYGKYMPALKNGLTLIGDTSMLTLVKSADSSYNLNVDKFRINKMKGDWAPLYDSLKVFETLDSVYYTRNERTMQKIENYVRRNPNEFLKFK
jgi:hypothetical protein